MHINCCSKMIYFLYAAIIMFCRVTRVHSQNTDDCSFYGLSHQITETLCSVQSSKWYIHMESPAIKNAGCLLAQGETNRCNEVIRIPKPGELEVSSIPPDAKNKQYQMLAMTAESIIPKVWWRDSFADPSLLLSINDQVLPRKLLDITRMRSKKLRNMLQCVTRQQFIRKSISLSAEESFPNKCNAMTDPAVSSFYTKWMAQKDTINHNKTYSDTLLVSAMEAIDYFYLNHGGIWTGCFKMDNSSSCRGALAAASLVASNSILREVVSKGKSFAKENSFVAGYMLASLGRALLHGDSDTVAGKLAYITVWRVAIADFIGLQAAYMKLYIESFGSVYNKQLNRHIPMTFYPEFPMLSQVKLEWRQYAGELEPVYTSLRNWMFTESQVLIDFGPYRTLVSFPAVRERLVRSRCKRVLIDVGANGFFASPKYLLDSYSVHLPFTDAIMIEPEPHFSALVPEAYKRAYNIQFLKIYAEVNTGSDTDMIKLLPTLVTKEDFVVLKFDVDPNRYAQGPTMEWGFLFSIMQNPAVVELIDELYIELHFHFPALYWSHYHSNWEALDILRYLRSQGVIVHSWP